MPWHGFLQRMHEFEEAGSKIFFYKPLEWFFDRGFGNTWQLALNRVHETSKKIFCNSKMASLDATWTKEQNVKTDGESLDDKVGPETMKHVWQSKKKIWWQMIEQPKSNCFHDIVLQKT